MKPLDWNTLLGVYLLSFYLTFCQCIDFTYYVKEDRNPGVYLGDITRDTHIDELLITDRNLIRFKQLQKDTKNGELFNVSKTGKLYTAQRLDAEALCKYNTECSRIVDIAVQKKESFLRILEIKVIIEDVNDHQPEFPTKEIELQFDETDGKGTRRSIPNAIDKDIGILNSQISYELVKNNYDPFSLAVSKRVDGSYSLGITLETTLDREVKEIYMLQVIAKDGGYPPEQGVLNIKISVSDVNDNSPVFSQNVYNVTVNNRQGNSPIITLSATDLDSGRNGNISYYFSSKTTDDAKQNFMLNELTGEILLPEKFKSGEVNKYKLFIEAQDGGNPPLSSIATVLVNMVNSHNDAPIIDVNFVSKSNGNAASISEGVEVGSFIAYVKVTDNDNGENGNVDCVVDHEHFQLQKLGEKKYKVIIKKVVDREVESNINLVISCHDNGIPSLKSERKFSIQVTDINDVQPHFAKTMFKFLTYENENPFFPIGLINATDPDLGPGGELTYYLLSNNRYNFPFKISKFGFISTTQSLDHEQQEIYKFKVLVQDNGIPSLNNTADVVVEVMDENDNAPYFTFPSVNPFNLDVHYHPKSKSDITTLRASDRDSHVNSFLRYEIIKGNNKQMFTVNPYSGVLSYSRAIYQNDAGLYELHIAVKDSGTPVLTATTTLFLTLTVSNKTLKMFTAVDAQYDDKIHINLFIIIVIVAMTASVILVVSITICIVRKNNRRNSQQRGELRPSNVFLDENRQLEYLCEQAALQYDSPSAMAVRLPPEHSKEFHKAKPSREDNFKHELTCERKPSQSPSHYPDNIDRSIQVQPPTSPLYTQVQVRHHYKK